MYIKFILFIIALMNVCQAVASAYPSQIATLGQAVYFAPEESVGYEINKSLGNHFVCKLLLINGNPVSGIISPYGSFQFNEKTFNLKENHRLLVTEIDGTYLSDDDGYIIFENTSFGFANLICQTS